MSDDPQAQGQAPADQTQSTDGGHRGSRSSRSSSSSTTSSGTTNGTATAPAARGGPPASDEMEDQTPRQPGDILVSSDSRLNALRDAGPKKRDQLVWMQYEGRKGSTGGVRRVADEHIDLVVPDEDNEAAASLYLDYISPAGVLTPNVKQQLQEQGVSHETLQMSGTHLHFHANSGPTPVDPDQVDWLLNHPGYSFKQVDPP
jgi:hypothetical protein